MIRFVALRKESVDRNILGFGFCIFQCGVALRKESVDRNLAITPTGHGQSTSLSARRAWIEIMRRMLLIRFCPVALRKESVDRNNRRSTAIDNAKIGRSPQGERG